MKRRGRCITDRPFAAIRVIRRVITQRNGPRQSGHVVNRNMGVTRAAVGPAVPAGRERGGTCPYFRNHPDAKQTCVAVSVTLRFLRRLPSAFRFLENVANFGGLGEVWGGMKPNRVRLFVKPYCGWCHEAQDWLEERGIQFETLDVTSDRAARQEMVDLSGQTLAPVIEVDGEVLADFDTDQLEVFWKKLEKSAA